MAKRPSNGTPEPGTPEPGTPEPAAQAAQSRVQPTEQVETTPLPVSARAAASGGATGLTDVAPATSEPGSNALREKPSIFRRHPIATGIVAAVIAVIVASGLTAWGVGTAVTASLTNQTAPVAPLPTATSTPQPSTQGGVLAAGRLAFRATIQSIGDSTWTILTKRGQTVTVEITSSTQFGTKKAAQAENSFAVGDSVLVVATKVDGTATAIRVVSATPTPSPTSTATT